MSPAAAMARASITIDVDSLRFYRAIHGRDADALPLADDPIYTVALGRFFELLARHRAPATLFLVGQDAPAHAAALAPHRALACELASHSFAHDYRLSQRSAPEIADDLARADAALAALAGAPVRGFRAPGYNLSPALLAAVAARGYAYDSSLLPAPAYFAARAAAIAAYGALGRPSASLTGDARQFAGPLDGPYRIGRSRPWARDDGGPLWEVPMAVDPITRTPLFGTAITALPAAVTAVMLRAALARLRTVVIELHAIDLLDATDHPALAELARDQRDVRVPAATKLARLGAVLERLAGERPLSTLAAIVDA